MLLKDYIYHRVTQFIESTQDSTDFYLEKILNESLDIVKRNINNYINQGKITKEKAEIYINALKDMFFDAVNTGKIGFYRQYLERHMIVENYRRDERQIFEYIVGRFKKELKKRLRKYCCE